MPRLGYITSCLIHVYIQVYTTQSLPDIQTDRRRQTDGQIDTDRADRQTGRHTGRAERQTNRQIDTDRQPDGRRQTHRQTDIQTAKSGLTLMMVFFPGSRSQGG